MSASGNADRRPCGEIVTWVRQGDKPWCAAVANGNPRCPDGTCRAASSGTAP